MVVGINRNVGGKYAHLEHEIEGWVQEIIREVTEFRAGRAGKDHWLKHIKGSVERFLGREMVNDAEAFSYIAFTEAIKCSPDWQLSIPTETMTKNCLYEMRYLKQEIELLRPRLVIAFGADTARLIRNIYRRDNRSENPEDDEDVYRISSDGHTFCVVGYFHPSHPRFPRMINKYLAMSLSSLRSDIDLKDKISEEIIDLVKRKTKNTDYFRNLFELNLVDEARDRLRS